MDDSRVDVAFGVVFGQDGKGLLLTVLADEPTRALGKHEDSANLQGRRANLKKRRNAPAPVSLDIDRLDGDTSSQDSADEVGGVEQRGQNGTLLGVSEFTDKGGSRNDGKDDTDTEQHTGNDVHANCRSLSVGKFYHAEGSHTVLGETLEKGANNHDNGTRHNAPPPTKALVAVRSEGDSDNGTELVAG